MPLALSRTERRRTSPAGFTLLELVAIVAISGVLMSLLLPALSSAKEKSRRSVCGQNERQIVFALLDYGDANHEFLPAATDNSGDYHSIVLSSQTFSNMMDYLYNESNLLYCPNLAQAAGKMGGYDPQTGYTIGYSYLAATELPATAKGPDIGWSGPLNTTEASEVIADANYWVNASHAMTLAPHTSGGSVAMVSTGSSTVPAGSATRMPGSSSTAAGAIGGNVGSLDGSVIWMPIGLMGKYHASGDGSAFGNW